MRYALSLLLALSSITWAAEVPHYLPSIHQRWDASDLVCIARASSPVRSGLTRTIDGSDRDQLSADIEIETCFKGERPAASEIRVIGYDVVATKDISQGYAYSGAPTGFISKGRNLLFLCRTDMQNEFEVTVPIYQTAIHLADNRPNSAGEESRESERHLLIQEFEAALVQFDDGDLSYIGYLFDLLGSHEGITELSRFSPSTPVPVQRDIAVALLSHDQQNSEPMVASLLLDSSEPSWKRENAAWALGEHGTKAAFGPLQKIVSQPTTTDDLKALRLSVQSSLHRLEQRLSTK